jgi:serine/threonine protein kinase
MGDVFLAEHVNIERKAAIKVLHAEIARNENIRKRFKQEATMMAQLQHGNIVGLYDYFEDESGMYLILEYVDGLPLDSCIKNHWGPVPSDRILGLLLPILNALAYAHEKGIVHRDIKPANILVDRKGAVKILDFGIAKLVSSEANNLTRTGVQMGTVYYMSPEQVKGLDIDFRTDIYSMGITMYQMLTGGCPYEGLTTEYEIYSRIVNQNLVPASEIIPGVHPALDRIVSIATSKDREKRFQSCNEMLQVLQNPQYLSRYSN